MKRIFYFNITYGCNNNCIFCYSHNTCHNSVSYNEILAIDFFDYLERQKIRVDDRIIINGGEPFLHTEIDEILAGLAKYGCEVLIYTNGRLLMQHDLSMLSGRYRFIVPIHGYERIHDFITGVYGSYLDTLNCLEYLTKTSKCQIDIKIIINNCLISEDNKGKRIIASLQNVKFNNAVHITKMADTIVSKKNKCKSVSNYDAAYYTGILFDYFKKENRRIKIFDTCIKGIFLGKEYEYKKYEEAITVYFKDRNQYREIDLKRRITNCMEGCNCLDKCVSAVNEYKVLEYYDGKIFENLE